MKPQDRSTPRSFTPRSRDSRPAPNRPAPQRASPGSSRTGPARTGLARALSKFGFCSRSEAWKLIQAGQVSVNGVVRLDPEWPTVLERDRLEVAGQPIAAQTTVYLMLNKPRGLVTTARDEKGRATVFSSSASLSAAPHLFPVGRLDQASEGLLLFTNDAAWAERISDPASHLDKTYHVQVDCVADEPLLERMRQGVQAEQEHLAVKRVSLLRHGEKNSWLEVALDEGKNRHIRRLLSALDVNVLRLLRVAVGPLNLGDLPKGHTRPLTPAEVGALAACGTAPVPGVERRPGKRTI